MDLYTVNSSPPFEPLDIISDYQSLIWTERFSSFGDFELVTPNVEETLAKIPPSTILSIRQSPYLMITQKRKIVKSDDGSYLLTISGGSLETFLNARAARTSGQTSETEWTFNNYPTVAAKSIFDSVVTNGSVNVADKITNLRFISSVVESGPVPTIIVKARDLYSAITEALASSKCGIFPHKFVDGSGEYLYLEAYKGVDRSINQITVDPLIFHVANDDIVDASYLFTNVDYYNVAYVYSPKGTRVIYADGIDPTISGWNRRVIYVDAGDISVDTSSSVANAAMDERGKQTLAEHNKTLLFDGKINPVSTTYKTPEDYYLGDLVTLIADYGVNQTMQIEEIIRISDAEGERTYPTLITV